MYDNMATKSKRPLLSAHEKVEAIKRVHEGESKASVARDIGVPESTLRGWCKNEDKILFLSRQSLTPENKSMEHDMKKIKLEYPISSMPNSSTVSSPLSSLHYSSPNTTEDSIPEQSLAPNYDPKYNLLAPVKILPKRNNIPSLQGKSKELPRLDMGMNHNSNIYEHLNVKVPQQGLNMSLLSGNSMNHLSGGSTLNNYNQFQNLAQTWTQANAFNAAAVQMKNGSLNPKPSSSKKPMETGLNLSQKDGKKPDDNTAVWMWLKTQQELLNLAQTSQKVSPTGGNQMQMPLFNGNDPIRNAMILKWYQQNYYNIVTNNAQLNTEPDNNILLQQLTKQPEITKQPSREPTPTHRESPKPSTPIPQYASPIPSPVIQHIQHVQQGQHVQHPSKASPDLSPEFYPNKLSPEPKQSTKLRSVLDNIVSNNNNVITDDEVNENELEQPKLSSIEAIEHGQIFLKWLEQCSDPAVSSKQVTDFRYLLTNIKKSADRKQKVINEPIRVNRRKPAHCIYYYPSEKSAKIYNWE